MGVRDVFFKTQARAVLTGFMANRRIMDTVTVYDDLQRVPGTNAVDVPIWSSFTVLSMGAGSLTPCGSNRECDEATATILTIDIDTKYIPTPISLGDLNIFSAKQKAGVTERILQDLARDFEVISPGFSIFDVLATDALFNGAGGGMTPLQLTDNAAGYRNLATAISTAMGKDNGSGVTFVGPAGLTGFINSIPDRQIERMLQGVKMINVPNANTFNGAPGFTQGTIGFIYPTDALAYAAPPVQDDNEPLSGTAGNMWSMILHDTTIPGKMLYFAHQYGLKVVREGDVQLIASP